MKHIIKVHISVYRNDDDLTDIFNVDRKTETDSVEDAESAGVRLDNAILPILLEIPRKSRTESPERVALQTLLQVMSHDADGYLVKTYHLPGLDAAILEAQKVLARK